MNTEAIIYTISPPPQFHGLFETGKQLMPFRKLGPQCGPHTHAHFILARKHQPCLLCHRFVVHRTCMLPPAPMTLPHSCVAMALKGNNWDAGELAQIHDSLKLELMRVHEDNTPTYTATHSYFSSRVGFGESAVHSLPSLPCCFMLSTVAL